MQNHSLENREAFSRIDWCAPWLADFQEIGQAIIQNINPLHNFHDKLNAAWSGRWPLNSQPPVFVPQSDLPKNVAYESHIFEKKRIPTRENLHDFFNALIWLHFPQFKSHLNFLQNRAIIENQKNGILQRGRVRDAVTVLDENGAFFIAPVHLIEALRQRQWGRLCVDLRQEWKKARLVIVGHALLEQLTQPRKNLCAHVLTVEADYLPHNADLDLLFASDARLEYAALHNAPHKPFVPLPILGVPHWCADNAQADFYADLAVFRPLH